MKKLGNKGFSMLEVMASAAVIGIAAVGFYQMSKVRSTMEMTSDTSLELVTFHEEVLHSGLSLLTNVRDTDSKSPTFKQNTKGVCSIVSTPAKYPGVDMVKIDISGKAAREFFPDEVWSKNFSNSILALLTDDSLAKLPKDIKDKVPEKCKATTGDEAMAWTRCLVLWEDMKGKDLSKFKGYNEAQLKKLNLVAVLSLMPVNMDPAPDPLKPSKEKIFEAIDWEKAKTPRDVKKVGFNLKSEIFYDSPSSQDAKGNPDRKISEKNSFFWPGDISFCDWNFVHQGEAKHMKLSLAGVSPGDPTGNTVYNRFNFSAKDIVEPVTGFFRRRQIIQGIFDKGVLTSDDRVSLEVTCNEQRFACRNKPSSSRKFGTLSASVVLNYNSRSELTKNQPDITVAPEFRIASLTEDAIPDKSQIEYRMATNSAQPPDDPNDPKQQESYFFASNPLYARSPNKANIPGTTPPRLEREKDHFYWMKEKSNYPNDPTTEWAKNSQGKGIEMSLKGTHELVATLRDSYAQSQCVQICSNPSKVFYPSLFLKIWNTTQGVYEHTIGGEGVTRKVGCIACYTKNCSRLGFNTFGPMENMPDEPLDAGIPECAKDESSAAERADMSHLAGLLSDASSDRCVAVRLNSGGGIGLVRAPCASASKQPLCFDFGRFMRAQNTETNAFPKESIWTAGNRCYWMGREEVDKGKFTAFIKQEGLKWDTMKFDDLPVKGDKVVYLNLTKQGMFVAPQLSSQTGNLYAKMSAVRSQAVADGMEFLTALYMDETVQGGAPGTQVMLAFPPFLPVQPVTGSMPENDGANYNDDGKRHKFKRFGMFFLPNGNFYSKYVPELLHDKMGAKLKTGGDAVGAGVLVHNYAYKGVYEVSPNQPSSFSPRFLCFDVSSGQFTKSAQGSNNFADGVAKCRASGYEFVPPMTPLQWVAAMKSVVAGTSDNYAFPDPMSTDWKDVLWVAIQFKKDSPTDPGPQPNNPMSGWELAGKPAFDNDHYKKGTATNVNKVFCHKDGMDRFVVRTVPAAGPYDCQAGEYRVSRKHLNAGLRNSIFFRIAEKSIDSNDVVYIKD